MKLLREITEDYKTEVIPIMEAISSAVKELKMAKKGGLVTDKMVKAFMKSNKNLVVASALNSLAAYKQYKTNKRGTVTFFAKSAFEKRIVRDIVSGMLNSKQYKLKKQRYTQGGKIWELQKVKAGFK